MIIIFNNVLLRLINFMSENTLKFWMKYALNLAKKAQEEGEIPVGAVLVLKNQILGEGWNRNIGNHDPTAHAEIIAIRSAAIKLKNYRLINSTLYVTLEPCLMCSGAIMYSRVKHIVFGTQNNKVKNSLSLSKIFNTFNISKNIKVTKGILSHSCSVIIKDFFHNIRLEKNQ